MFLIAEPSRFRREALREGLAGGMGDLVRRLDHRLVQGEGPLRAGGLPAHKRGPGVDGRRTVDAAGPRKTGTALRLLHSPTNGLRQQETGQGALVARQERRRSKVSSQLKKLIVISLARFSYFPYPSGVC